MGCRARRSFPATVPPHRVPALRSRSRRGRQSKKTGDRARPRKRPISCGRAPGLQSGAILTGRPDESREQRMPVARRRGELRVKLAGDEPRMRTQLDELDQAVGRESGEAQAGRGQLLEIMIVEFITMTMTLEYGFLAVQRVRQRTGEQ